MICLDRRLSRSALLLLVPMVPVSMSSPKLLHSIGH